MGDYLEDWLEKKALGMVRNRKGQQRRARPRARTLADLRSILQTWVLTPTDERAVLRSLRARRLDKLTGDHLTSFYEQMVTFATPYTVKKLHKALKHAFAHYARGGLQNPADDALVPLPDQPTASAQRDEQVEVLDEDQTRRMLDAGRALADEQEAAGPSLNPARLFSALWHVLLWGALRPHEALALQWDAVIDIGHKVKVVHDLVRIRGHAGYTLEPPKTDSSTDEVPLGDAAWAELMGWRKVQKEQRLFAGAGWTERSRHFVFTCSNGGPLQDKAFYAAWRRVCARAGLGEWGPEHERGACWCGRAHPATGPLPQPRFAPAFRPYACRHTCATLMVANGVPLPQVAKHLRHKNSQMILTVYGHWLPDGQHKAVRKLDDALHRIA